MKIKLINKSSNDVPAYQTKGSAGLDLKTSFDKQSEILYFDFFNEEDIKIVDTDENGDYIFINPSDRVLFPTGLYIELPEGYEAQFRSRSGLSLKQGLIVTNQPATIDSDYRGELKIMITNISNVSQKIYNSTRIAQMVFNKVEQFDFNIVKSISETDRGEGGFGHTGI